MSDPKHLDLTFTQKFGVKPGDMNKVLMQTHSVPNPIDYALELLKDVNPATTLEALRTMREFERKGGVVNYKTGDMAISQFHMDEK